MEVLQELMEERQNAELFEAEIYQGDVDQLAELTPAIRKTQIVGISHRQYPEICAYLLSLLDTPSKYTIGEFNYLVYDREGDHFKAHKDWSPTDNVRQYTTITMLKKDNLKGGVLQVWDDDMCMHEIDLEVGQTIIFGAHQWHKVTKIESGSREVLVAWVWKR